MRWCTYLSPTDRSERVGVVEDDVVFGSQEAIRLVELLGDDGARLEAAGRAARSDPFERVPVAEAVLRPPVPVPPSIRDFMAFEEHVVTSARAMDHDVAPVWYEMPVFYFTNPAAALGARDPVEIAPGCVQWDYELEVAAVIGRPGRDLDPATAEEHVAGYVILCDWSARDLQRSEMRSHLGPAKGKDSATSFGPWMTTRDELAARRAGNGYDLAMTASVNGRSYSAGNLSTIYWNFGQLLAYASRGTELRPGDVVASGTVGTGCILELSRVHGGASYPWLVSGDTVRLEIDELGAIEAEVRPSRPVVPLG